MHTKWRDCKEWKEEGLEMSSCSNEAVKLYDAVLSQYVAWYDEPSVGGIESAMEKMMQADPNFVMGEVITKGLDLMGTGRTTRNDPVFATEISNLVDRTEKLDINPRERRHVSAINLFSHGKFQDASRIWEGILLDHPRDMLALKMAHDTYFYMGKSLQIRDSIARVIPHWDSSVPLYGYLHGMHSFGLVETNLFDRAEKSARQALHINRHDAWGTHTMAHVFEMTGRHKEGVAFLSGTLPDWEKCGMLACHNFWHWALYHIERGEHDAALNIYDQACIGRATNTSALLDIVDVCSLLLRLQMEGVDVGSRWEEAFAVTKAHNSDHILVFNDAHLLMTCVGAGRKGDVDGMMQGIEDYMGLDEDQSGIFRNIGLDLCKSVVAFGEGRYSESVDLLSPLKYDVINIGGSNAQRDLFDLLLINSAIKSTEKSHNKLAIQLLHERKAMKCDAPMTDRLMAKALAVHGM